MSEASQPVHGFRVRRIIAVISCGIALIGVWVSFLGSQIGRPAGPGNTLSCSKFGCAVYPDSTGTSIELIGLAIMAVGLVSTAAACLSPAVAAGGIWWPPGERAVAAGEDMTRAGRLLRAVSWAMPPSQRQVWLAVVSNSLSECSPQERRPISRSYLETAPIVIAMSWAHTVSGQVSQVISRRTPPGR